MNWSEEFLYNKAKIFMQRGVNEDASSEMFPFWASLSLELLCRAALAKKHPILLADPRDEDNLLYACGENTGKSPKSLAISIIIGRCRKYVPRFEDSHVELANQMMELRNAELHSAEAAFNALAASSWQPDFYTLVEVLLSHLGRSLEDYLGAEVAARANRMLQARTAETKKDVLQRISRCKQWVEQLEKKSLQEKQKQAESKVNEIVQRSPLARECKCPACGNQAAMLGEVTDSGEAKLNDGEITVEKRVLPKSFRCFVCDLRLNNFTEMHIANLGAIYTINETEDPIEYFGIVPEEHVDVEELMREHYADEYMDE